MNKKQFETLQQSLAEQGYRKFDQHWNGEDYAIGKSFHRSDNQFKEGRACYQVFLNIYDNALHPEYHDRQPAEYRDHVGIEVWIMVSRTIYERMDLVFSWHDDTTIAEVEQKAESFYQWACHEYPTPRKE